MTSNEKEWVTLLAEILERLTEKHASITYDFDGLTFESETVSDNKGITIPPVRVKINGKITITAG
ncbi:MAG: hypothetical protein ACRD94_00460 [Nitrosopumilaceae archaeon]